MGALVRESRPLRRRYDGDSARASLRTERGALFGKEPCVDSHSAQALSRWVDSKENQR